MTIRAAVPGTVVVAYDASVLSPVCSSDPFCLVVESRTRITPPAGQTVHCEGLEFAALPNPFFANHAVLVAGDTATFAQCSLRACSFLTRSRGDYDLIQI